LRGLGKSGGLKRLQGTQSAPVDWQEHGVDAKRDRVSLSDDAQKWQQGDWLDGGLEPGEDPSATAKELVRDPQFAQQAKKLHKPRVQLREMARQSAPSLEGSSTQEDAFLGLPGPSETTHAPIDPKIAMASRHAPLDTLFQRGPQTLNMRANLALPGGHVIPLTASFEMGQGQMLQAAFGALAG